MILPWTVHKAFAHIRGAVWARIWSAKGIRFASRPVIYGAQPSISGGTAIQFGERLQLRGFDGPITIRAMGAAHLTIGNRVLLNAGVKIEVSKAVTIGDNCLIGDGVQIHDSNYHEVDEGSGVTSAPIVIGRNVWLGRDVIVMPGVTIGDHTVVAARSVVTKSLPGKVLAAGTPAKVLREIKASENWIRY